MDDSTQQQQQQEHAIAAALQQQQQEEQIKEEQIKEQQQQQEQEQEQQQQEQEQQQQQQQEQQQFQHLSLHSAHDTLDHDALANRDANGLVLQTTLGSNADGQLILQHAAAATGNLLHHHDLANNVASHVLQDSHDHSSSSSSTTAAAAAAAVAAAATAASLASLESLDSVMAEAVVAASKSAVNGSVSTSPSSSSAPSVAAVAAIATGATLGSPSSSLPAGPSSSSMTNSSSSASRITSSANAMAMENGGEGSSGDRYDKCPAVFKWPADDWETWLDQEKTYCRWNMVRHRHRDKQTFARGPTASEWTREFQCDHAGQYRDRKNPNIDPSKKRKRNGSIKCNCPAFIKMRKQFHEDEVLIEYSWRHEGHVPDVMEDIKAHRVPQDLKAWIKERVNEGLDWKTVKSMITSGSPMLDELHPATKQNAKALLPSCYAFYANTARQFKNRGSSRSTSSPASERASRGGNVIRFDEKTALAQRLSQSPSPQTAQQSSSSSSREVNSSTGQDQKHSTSAEGSTHIPHTSTWQIVTLESTHPSGPGHGFTGSNGFHTNNANHDSQTLAVHTLTAPNTTHTSTHDHLKHQVLAISEPLLNAESISRVIREQGTAQDMAALSLVTSASLDGVNGAPGLGSLTTGATATSHDAAAAATVANMLYNSSREHSGLQEVGSASAGASTQGAVAALMQQQQQEQEQRTGTEVIQNQEQQQQQQQSEASATTLQQQIQQHVQDRSPRDMMLEVLRAIADLHKQMEATEQYGTQEDAMEIIESFANPIRLMKEALERRSSSSQP